MTTAPAAAADKSTQEILAEALTNAQAGVKKEITKTVDAVLAEPRFADAPKDFLAIVRREMRANGDFDDNGKLVLGKKRRTVDEWLQKNFPSILVAAEKPRGDVELNAAIAACGSLAMQGELIKAVGSQRASELMSLVGGKIGALTKPQPIKADPKPGEKKKTTDNVFEDETPEGVARRIEYIKKNGVLGPKGAIATALLVNRTVTGVRR